MFWFDWLFLFVCWFYVIVGVVWIGVLFYFIWFDNSLEILFEWKKKQGIKGDLWVVYGGGFYEVVKYVYGLQIMFKILYWFKWEVYLIWFSGIVLLIIVYYFVVVVYLIDFVVKSMSEVEVILCGIVLIVGGVIIYEIVCWIKLVNYLKVFVIVLVVMLVVVSYLVIYWFSGCGVYIYVGVLIGIIMVVNVWLNIMFVQCKMVNVVVN